MRQFILKKCALGIMLIASLTAFSQSLTTSELKTIHNEVKEEFVSLSELPPNFDEAKFNKKHINNIKFLNKHGVKKLLKVNQMNESLAEQAQMVVTNLDNDIYDLLVNNYQITNTDYAKSLFELVELTIAIKNAADESEQFERGISWQCGVAIASTIVVTVSAATTPIGAFLVGKTLATLGLIGSCP